MNDSTNETIGYQPEILHQELMATEQAFFRALVGADGEALDQLLANELTMIDLSGGIMSKTQLSTLVTSGELKFISIIPEEMQIRLYTQMAVVTGRTLMNAQYQSSHFRAPSRYTHVYTRKAHHWHLVAAQGTPIQQS